MHKNKSYFFCGIGGSGMLPLALILKGLGHQVSGSDRSRDQGRTPDKFTKLEKDGFTLFPQDGSGLQGEVSDLASSVCIAGEFNRPDFLVVSVAVEDTVPDVVAAKTGSIPILKRAELLAEIGLDRKGRFPRELLGHDGAAKVVHDPAGQIASAMVRVARTIWNNIPCQSLPFESAVSARAGVAVVPRSPDEGSVSVDRGAVDAAASII